MTRARWAAAIALVVAVAIAIALVYRALPQIRQGTPVGETSTTAHTTTYTSTPYAWATTTTTPYGATTTPQAATTTAQAATTTTPPPPELLEKFRHALSAIDILTGGVNSPRLYRSQLLEPLFRTVEYMYLAQLRYSRYGGHGLIPLVSLTPGEVVNYTTLYSLEVSEFSAEVPWIYAWLYWITGNETWLELARYSVDAVRYWSIDSVPLGGCWGTTDPIVYNESLGVYVVRWKLLTWYMQSQPAWWYDSWFNESVWRAWNYTAWYDPRYDWYWFTPWEIVYYGPPSEYAVYKRAFIGFVHSWIDHVWSMYAPPYAYILNSSALTLGPYARRTGDEVVFEFNIAEARRSYAVSSKPIILVGNGAYSVVLNIMNAGDAANVTVVLYNNETSYRLVFPRLPATGGYVNVTMGSIYVPEDGGGVYRLKLVVSQANTFKVDIRLRAIGVVATPNLGLHGLTPSYMFWGDSIGPMATALLHYRPWMRGRVLEWVTRVLDEMFRSGTDATFYPPDRRWSFLYWDRQWLRVAVLKPPIHAGYNYASLEETLTGMIPLYILTGDRGLLREIRVNAGLLNHTNYWRGLGYWSAWFGIWVHLWLYAITGDPWYWGEASYYLGTTTPFSQALHEEISNAAKFIEANIAAYQLTGNRSYLELARSMAQVLVGEFRDPRYGFLRTKIYEPTIARHDMLAWTLSPLVSLVAGVWAPDWMLWLYPIAVGDGGRPNGFITLMNLTYAGEAIVVRQAFSGSVFAMGYSGFVIYPYGIGGLRSAPEDTYPYTAEITLLPGVYGSPALVGFNGTSGCINVTYATGVLRARSSLERIWIIRVGDRGFTGAVDGEPIVVGVNALLYKGYLIVEGRDVEVSYTG